MYLWFTCALCKNQNRYPLAQRLTPTEAVPIHITLHAGNRLGRSSISVKRTGGGSLRVVESQMSATTLLFLGSMIAIA